MMEQRVLVVLLQLVFQTGVGAIQHMVARTYLGYQEPAVSLAVALILVIMPSSVLTKKHHHLLIH